MPANSARARASAEPSRGERRRRQQRAAARSGPAASGCAGQPQTGRRSVGSSRSALARPAAPTAGGRPSASRAERRGRRRRPSARARTARAVVERMGQRRVRAGSIRGRARPAAGTGRTASASASGWTAEQTSWTKPGSVSSAERGAAADACRRPRRPGPTRPARASVIAAARPFGPEPTTTASSAHARPVTADRVAAGSAVGPSPATQRTGAVSVRGHRARPRCAACCRRTATGAAGRRTRPATRPRASATPSDRARFSSVRSQNRSFIRLPPSMYESSIERVARCAPGPGPGRRWRRRRDRPRT